MRPHLQLICPLTLRVNHHTSEPPPRVNLTGHYTRLINSVQFQPNWMKHHRNTFLLYVMCSFWWSPLTTVNSILKRHTINNSFLKYNKPILLWSKLVVEEIFVEVSQVENYSHCRSQRIFTFHLPKLPNPCRMLMDISPAAMIIYTQFWISAP